MARMMPAVPAHDSSDAELVMFRRLCSLPDDWVVLHSLGLARHARKPWSEIDFTVVGPLGVVLIEVKGGTVYREAAEWKVITGAGERHSLGRGPFQQVGGAEAATRHFLEDRLPWLADVTFGYLVATPDCRLEKDDLGIDQACVYDARRVGTGLIDVMSDVLAHWRGRMGRSAGLTRDDIDAVVGQICGDLPPLPDLRSQLHEVDRRMDQLTSEQQRAVRDLAETRAVWLSGPAGCGKTMLAVAEALRHSRDGSSVVFCCHTIALAEHVRSLVEGAIRPITVAQRHELIIVPDSESARFDVLVVDEAQDLLDREFTDHADSVLRGGLGEGVWRVFIDPNQALFGAVDQATVQRWLSTRPAIQRLSRNCRSTKAISLTASALTGVPLAGGVDDAPRPEVCFVTAGVESEAVLSAVEGLVAQGLDREEIIVLTPRRLENSVLRPVADRFVDFRARPTRGRIGHATIGAFKGLERKAVVVTGIDELRSVWIRQQLYVGCTRSTALLTVVLPLHLKEEVATGYMRALSADIASVQDA